MNYKRIYGEFIANRKGLEAVIAGYSEVHHIVPRCLGGGDESGNLIRLTAEDHFFAHVLLAKVHGGELWSALSMMCIGRSDCGHRYLRSMRKHFAIARERAGIQHSKKMKGYFAGERHPMFGKPCSELAKQKTRERHAAGLNPMASAEARQKVSSALKGRVFNSDHRRKISESRTGWKDSEATRAKKSATHTGMKQSPEAIEKTRAFHTGRKKSQAQVEKMRAANLGKKLSEETKKKISDRWATDGHPRGMLGKKHDPAFGEMMKRLNAGKRDYARRHGVSARTVTRSMIECDKQSYPPAHSAT